MNQDQDQFTQQLLKLRSNLYGWAMTKLRDRDKVEDLVSIVMVKLLEHRNQFPPGADFTPWAFRVLKNKIIDSYREHQRHPSCSLDSQILIDWHGSPEQQVSGQEMLKLINRLSPHYSATCRACWLDGLSMKEAAQLLGTSPMIVKHRLLRARKKLQPQLGDLSL